MDDDANKPHIAPWLTTVLRPIHNVFVPGFFRLTVRDADRIPTSGPAILTPTHRSRWDPVILPWLTNRLVRTMASHDEFVGVQGWFMRNLGAFPVNTRRPSAGTLKTCEEILRSGQLLVIYPEGTIYRYPPDHVHPLKPGTAWLALKAQQEMSDRPFPILPIRFRYGKLPPRFRTPVEVAVQPPILVTNFLDRPEKAAIRDLTAAIQAGMGDEVNTSRHEMSRPRDAGPDWHPEAAVRPAEKAPE